MRILAIDPGPVQSAWLSYDERPVVFGISPNEELLADLLNGSLWAFDVLAIEKVEGFGMAVGVEVFETVFWTGRFAQAVLPTPFKRIGRKTIKVHLCGSTRAKDTNIRTALVDRWGGETIAKGNKARPGPLYGIAKDVWSALAVAVTYSDQATTSEGAHG